MHPAFKYAVAWLCAVTAACDQGPETPRSKRIYSVLQSEELETKQRQVEHAYIYKKNAFGTEHSTIAFPLRNGRGEYIVFLANAKEDEPVYSVPSSDDVQFVLDKATFQEIRARKYVTSSLQQQLRQYVAR